MSQKFLHYNIAIQPLTQSKGWNAECNNLTFWNKGTQNCTINGVLTLTPGESITFPGYPGEMNQQAYDITFVNDLLPGCLLVIVMKVYQVHP